MAPSPSRRSGSRAQRHAAQRRRARLVGGVGVLVAAVLPVVLWHGVIADVARVSGWDATRVLGWAPWVLMALGLSCAIPLALEHLRDRTGRFHRPGSGVWVGWGVSLYLLGFALATQVAQIHGLHS